MEALAPGRYCTSHTCTTQRCLEARAGSDERFCVVHQTQEVEVYQPRPPVLQGGRASGRATIHNADYTRGAYDGFQFAMTFPSIDEAQNAWDNFTTQHSRPGPSGTQQRPRLMPTAEEDGGDLVENVTRQLGNFTVEEVVDNLGRANYEQGAAIP